MTWKLDLGANIQSDGSVHFKVWAPFQENLQVKVLRERGEPLFIPMKKQERGYYYAESKEVNKNDLYVYVLPNGTECSDPVSRYLPKGVFGPTQIIDPNSFVWTHHNWRGVEQGGLIFYECHVGAFTKEGTFEALITKIPYLKDLGINCLELMPVAQFPGKWNWGYDPVSLFAIQDTYGNPETLKKLINACHEAGIAVCLDVVYNHFGPEGCFLPEFGPYLTERYKTPWGKGVNFDDYFSDEVRHFIMQNALYWITEYHVDALRLDALHALYDFNATPFLKNLSQAVNKAALSLNRKVYLIAESDLNDSLLIRPYKQGGKGLNGLWCEDFHHALHVSLTQENNWFYYQDFTGLKDLVAVMKRSMVYDGKYSPWRKAAHGNSFKGIEPNKLVIFMQNHDQIGNRPLCDRIGKSISFEKEKLAAFVLLLSPYVPILFMGQEYSEDAPFEYFVDYDSKELMAAVSEGRKKLYSKVGSHFVLPTPASFHNSKLKGHGENLQKKGLFELYKQLIAFRKSHAFFQHLRHKDIKVHFSLREEWIAWEYEKFTIFCNFYEKNREISLPFLEQKEEIFLHSEQGKFSGKENIILASNKLFVSGPCAAIISKS